MAQTRNSDDRWRKICPPLYQRTDPARLPQRPLRQVQAWQYGPKGLILYGPTGTGKTRAAWLLIRRLFSEGVFVHALACTDFGNQLADRFRDKQGEPTWWLNNLAKIPCLFLDDIDKCVFTGRVEREFFALVEKRTSRRLPIIVTTNVVGSVIERALPAVGTALVRRLRDEDFFESVNFGT